MSTISRDLSVPLSAEDGFAINISASAALKRIEFSKVGHLDGISRQNASGTTHKLRNLDNAQYLVTAIFADDSRNSIKAHPVSVPTPPVFSKSYAAQTPGQVLDSAPSNTADPQTSFLQGLDNALKVMAGSFSSALYSAGKDQAAIDAMAVKQYEILLADDEQVQSFVITADEMAAGKELSDGAVFIKNYVRYECVVNAISDMGVSAPSAAFEALATDYPNKPLKITIGDQSSLASDVLRVLVPLSNDYDTWNQSSFLSGPSNDLIALQNGDETIQIKIYDWDDSVLKVTNPVWATMDTSVPYYLSSYSAIQVDITGIAIGRALKLKHTVSNKLGESIPSDWSEPILQMRTSLLAARTYTLSDYIAKPPSVPTVVDNQSVGDQNGNYVTITASSRTSVTNTGYQAGSINIESTSGVPLVIGSGYLDSEEMSKDGLEYGYSKSIAPGDSFSLSEPYASDNTYSITVFGTYTENQYATTGPNGEQGVGPHPAGGHPGFSTLSSATSVPILKHSIKSTAVLLDDASSEIKWRSVSGMAAPFVIYEHVFKSEGYGSVPISPVTECTKEFSTNGGVITFKRFGESATQYGLASSRMKVTATQGSSSSSTTYNVDDIKADRSPLTYGDLLNGEVTSLACQIDAWYSVSQTDLPSRNGASLSLDLTALQSKGLSSSTLDMVKGAAACDIDEEADFQNDIGLDIRPFKASTNPTSVVLSTANYHDEVLEATVSFAANGGREHKQILIDVLDRNADGDTQRASIIVPVTAAGLTEGYQLLRLYKASRNSLTSDNWVYQNTPISGTGSENGDNVVYKVSMRNNGTHSEASGVTESNVAVPYGNPTYAVSMNAAERSVTTTTTLNGRMITAEYVIGIDSTPSPSDAPLYKQMPAPNNGVLGTRPSTDNKGNVVSTYYFGSAPGGSTGGNFDSDLSKHFAAVQLEAGAADPIHNFYDNTGNMTPAF